MAKATRGMASGMARKEAQADRGERGAVMVTIVVTAMVIIMGVVILGIMTTIVIATREAMAAHIETLVG